MCVCVGVFLSKIVTPHFSFSLFPPLSSSSLPPFFLSISVSLSLSLSPPLSPKGAGESGKSTVVKQMKILHKDGFPEE